MSEENRFKELKDYLDRLENIQSELKEIHDNINHMKNFSNLGDVIIFPSKHESLMNSIKSIEGYLYLREQIKYIENKDKKDIKFNIGDALILDRDMMIAGKAGQHGTYEFAQFGINLRKHSHDYAILDIVDNYFVIATSANNHCLIYLDENQLQTCFIKKENIQANSYFKVEFILNGLKEDFIKYIKSIRLFDYKIECNEGDIYAGNDDQPTYRSKFLSIKYDELFGITGTAYFPGDLSNCIGNLSKHIEDIVIDFPSRFKFGLSRKKTEDIFKYNGKISAYTKEPNQRRSKFNVGLKGDSFFPKDVYNEKAKSRTLNFLEVTQLFTEKKEKIK